MNSSESNAHLSVFSKAANAMESDFYLLAKMKGTHAKTRLDRPSIPAKMGL